MNELYMRDNKRTYCKSLLVKPAPVAKITAQEAANILTSLANSKPENEACEKVLKINQR